MSFFSKSTQLVLVRVPETLVLPVSHRGPGLRGLVSVLSSLRRVATSLVLPGIINEEGNGRQDAAGQGTHNGDLGWAVVRCVAGLERLRANDVADGERAADNGGSEGTLRRAGDIGSSPLLPVSD